MGNVAPGFESVQAVLVEYAEVGAVVRGGSGNREEPRVARVRTRRSARRRAENVVRSSFQQPRVSGLTGFAAGRRAASHESSQRGIRSVHRGGRGRACRRERTGRRYSRNGGTRRAREQLHQRGAAVAPARTSRANAGVRAVRRGGRGSALASGIAAPRRRRRSLNVVPPGAWGATTRRNPQDRSDRLVNRRPRWARYRSPPESRRPSRLEQRTVSRPRRAARTTGSCVAVRAVGPFGRSWPSPGARSSLLGTGECQSVVRLQR